MENKANSWLVILTIAVIAAIAGGGLYYWNTQKQTIDPVVTVPAPTDETIESVDQNWLTYASDKGFSIGYPNDWELSENSGDNSDPSIISLRSSKTALQVKNQQIPYSQDINIYVYPTVADEPENEANNLGATTLDELVTSNQMITKIGTVKIGGLSGVDVVWGGYGAYYTILVAKDSQLYKIQFSRFSDKKDMTETEKEILESFEFSN